jgi:hypothetical protein
MLGILMALLMVGPVAAQERATVVPAEQPTEVLALVSVDALPSPHAEVWFLRFMLEPGGSLPLDVQIGPTVMAVEAGVLTLVTDQPVEIDGATAATTETVASAGQVVYVHKGTALAARNDGDVSVSVLTLLTFSGVVEVEQQQATGDTPQAEPIGFTQMPIGLTAAEFPEGPGTITIERVVLDPNATARTDVPGGAIAGGIEQGGVTVTVNSGNGFVWQDMMQPLGPQGGSRQPRRADVVAGDSGDLVANDSFGFWNAGVGWQAGDDGATILQTRIEPLATATPVS